jgi:predicted dehydrogenase
VPGAVRIGVLGAARIALGELRHVQATLCFPLPRFSDIRYNFGLAGGALMDAGCYAVNLVRLLGGGGEPVSSRRSADAWEQALSRTWTTPP